MWDKRLIDTGIGWEGRTKGRDLDGIGIGILNDNVMQIKQQPTCDKATPNNYLQFLSFSQDNDFYYWTKSLNNAKLFRFRLSTLVHLISQRDIWVHILILEK